MSANKNKGGLGRGLESLLSSTVSGVKKDISEISSALGKVSPMLLSGKTIVSLPVNEVIPNPRQPRKTFDADALNELAASIKIYGVIQPLIVRKKSDKFELVAGERRWRASKIAGIEKVPAIIRDMSDEVSLEEAIIENVQRENLNAMEEAESYALLMQEFGLTQDAVAEKVGKARSSVANTLRLNELPREVKESLLKNEISAGHARAILSAGNHIEQLRLWNRILKEELNVRSAEKVAAKKPDKAPKQAKPAELSMVEQKMSSRLGAKVELSGTEQKGIISIKYASRDDLDRLYALIVNNEVI